MLPVQEDLRERVQSIEFQLGHLSLKEIRFDVDSGAEIPTLLSHPLHAMFVCGFVWMRYDTDSHQFQMDLGRELAARRPFRNGDLLIFIEYTVKGCCRIGCKLVFPLSWDDRLVRHGSK